MKIRKILTLFALWLLASTANATIELKVTYIDKDGHEVVEDENFTAEVPLHIRLTSNPSGLDPEATVEWHIKNTQAGINITRYEQDTEFDLTVAGKTEILLQAMFENEVVESASLTITVAESHLEMPNAFSPNGDGINEYFQAKSNYKNIVEFHAYIFNRHGQKLYDWTDYTNEKAGWNGTYNGSPVKDGVYYVYVKARGADGIEYNIRRDVNLLRNFNVLEGGNP